VARASRPWSEETSSHGQDAHATLLASREPPSIGICARSKDLLSMRLDLIATCFTIQDLSPERRGTARGSGRTARTLAEVMDLSAALPLEPANLREASPAAATRPANLTRKDLRGQGGLTDASGRRD
jgi:hypothetical protein